jgi:polysaccharide pyruvyl transferase WcaK-like protein
LSFAKIAPQQSEQTSFSRVASAEARQSWDRSVADYSQDAVTICLYLAVTEESETRKEVAPWPQRLKSLTRHSLDRVATKLSHRLHLDVYHYETAHGLGDSSNRGDAAIRIATKQQLTKAFAPRRVRFREVKWGELTASTVEEINHGCDIFVIGGGGYIFLDANGSVGHMLENVAELDAIRCPIFAYGIGLNRLMHQETCDLDGLPESSRRRIRHLAKRCELISVRDAGAAKLFELYAGKQVALTGDPVLSYVAEKRLLPVVSPNRPVIGINLAAHGWRALSMLKPLLPTAIDFFKKIQRSHGAQLVYLQHHDLERPIIDFLRAEGLDFELVCGTPDDLMGGYSKTDFVICQMLHACIFAAAAGKVFLNLAYDEKNVAFAKLLGMPECCLPHRDVAPDLLERTFASLFQNRAELRKSLEPRRKVLQLAQARFAEQVAAQTERLASQYGFAGAYDEAGDDLPHLSGSEMDAVVLQARNSGSRLH